MSATLLVAWWQSLEVHWSTFCVNLSKFVQIRSVYRVFLCIYCVRVLCICILFDVAWNFVYSVDVLMTNNKIDTNLVYAWLHRFIKMPHNKQKPKKVTNIAVGCFILALIVFHAQYALDRKQQIHHRRLLPPPIRLRSISTLSSICIDCCY